MEDVSCIGPERDDIPERFEGRELFKDDDVVTLQVTFDCGGESTEAGADDDDFDAGFGLGFSVGSVVGSHFKFCGLCFGGAKGQFMQTYPGCGAKRFRGKVTAGRQVFGPDPEHPLLRSATTKF